MKLRAYPGTYLLEKLPKTSSVVLGKEKQKHIISGRITDVGLPRVHDSGGKLEPFLKPGTILYFLSYGSEDYEEFQFEGKTYFSVIFNDGRAFVEE